MKRPLFPLRYNYFTTLAFHRFFFMYFPIPSWPKDHYRLICQVGHAALHIFDLSAPLAIQYRTLFSNPDFSGFFRRVVFGGPESLFFEEAINFSAL